MPTKLKKTADRLSAEYAKKWAGFQLNGQGVLVPYSKEAREVRIYTRSAEFEAKGYDPKAKLFIAGMANAKEIDRMNEVCNPTGVQTDAFVKNAVLLYQHNHSCPIGLVTMIRPEDNGVHFEAWVGDPAAAPLTKMQDEVRSLVSQRVLKAVSVGFIPHKIRMPSYNERGDIVEPAMIEEWELLELSIVSVPCNAGALFDLKDETSQGAKSTPRVWSFPTLGADGRFITKPKTLETEEMDELKELLQKLGLSLDGIASALNGIKDGQAAMQTSLDSLGAAGKGAKPDPKEDEDEEEDDEEAKALKASVEALDARLKAVEGEVADVLKTLELVVKKITGEQAA